MKYRPDHSRKRSKYHRLIADAGRRQFGNRLRGRMTDRICNFVKGIFRMTPFDLPADDHPSPPGRAKSVAPSVRGRTLKLPQDTVQGCRDRATADLLEAVTMVTGNQRRRLERSAERWTVRVELLDRLNKSFEKRGELDRASKQYEIDHVRL